MSNLLSHSSSLNGKGNKVYEKFVPVKLFFTQINKQVLGVRSIQIIAHILYRSGCLAVGAFLPSGGVGRGYLITVTKSGGL